MPEFKIFQKDINGNLLNSFDNLDEASLKTGLSKDMIDENTVFESCIPFSIKSLSDMKLKMIYWSDKV
jgi:hypothetical protein